MKSNDSKNNFATHFFIYSLDGGNDIGNNGNNLGNDGKMMIMKGGNDGKMAVEKFFFNLIREVFFQQPPS